MHCGVAAGAPTGSLAQVGRVISLADVNLSASNAWALILRVAFQAKVRVIFRQHLAIDGTVWVMANGAAFAERFVLENKWPRLLAMTTRTTLVQSRHGKAASRFENIEAMWIMALDTIHSAFDDGMALRQIEFCVGLEMALETSGRVFAGINDEFSPTAARFDMLASGSVA
jgi:hypothetical protein